MPFSDETCKDGKLHEWATDLGWDDQGVKVFKRISHCVRCTAQRTESIAVPQEKHGGFCRCFDGQFCQAYIVTTVIP